MVRPAIAITNIYFPFLKRTLSGVGDLVSQGVIRNLKLNTEKISRATST